MTPTLTAPATALLSTAQVAEIIDRTPRRVLQLVQEGQIRPAQQFSAGTRCSWLVFHALEIERFLAVRDR